MRIFYTGISRLIFTAFLASISTLGFSQIAVTVTNTNDAGAGSLRQAILDLNVNNANGIGDTINFNIATVGPHTITLATPLPQIVSTIFINGYSEPDAVMGPIGARTIAVRIDGAGLAAPIFDIGDGVDGGNNVTIAGLNLVNVDGNAIQLNDFMNGLRVWGCYIGTDITGTTAAVADTITGAGIYLGISPGPQSLTSNSVIGADSSIFNLGLDEHEGNVIGNSTIGINSVGQQNLKIAGNFVGIGADSVSNIGNSLTGILINTGSINCTVGVNDTTDTEPIHEKNYVGNNNEGITVRDGATGTIVAGNFVGVTPTGANAGNAQQGIIIESAPANRIGTNADGVQDAEERNTILYNGDGILLYNGANAALIEDKVAINNTIMGNTIDSNSVAIILDNQDLDGDVVTGNIIGSDGVGTNGLIEANLIRGNLNGGVLVESFLAPVAPIDLTRISMNSFAGNSSDQVNPGISIGFNSIGTIVPNDAGDADGGPNGQLNRPVIDAIGTNGVDSFFVSGWAEPGQTIEFYIASGTTTFGGSTNLPFGEPNIYLVSVTEGAAATTGITADQDATTSFYPDDGSTFGAPVSNNANRFKFAINFSAIANSGLIAAGQDIVAIGLSAASGPANTSMGSAIELSILPVTYVSFTATPSGNTVKLNWKTATESNSSHFDVQRSADGISYTTIGSVTAAGNAQTTTNYDYVDANPIKGAISYYRLKQVDLDGKFEYSKVVLVKSSGNNNRFAIAPNPVKSSMVISLVSENNETLSLRIIDNNGKVVKSYRQPVVNGANQIRLNDLGSIPNGVYILQISGKSTLINEKIMKY